LIVALLFIIDEHEERIPELEEKMEMNEMEGGITHVRIL